MSRGSAMSGAVNDSDLDAKADAMFRKIVEAVWRDGNATIPDQDDDYVQERVDEIMARIREGRKLR